MSEINTVFWNIQNLFDTKVSDIAADLDFTPEKGWDTETMNQKIDNLCEIINQIHSKKPISLFGMCEIENDSLTKKLIQKSDLENFEIVQVDSPDFRGIDTALAYSTEIFEFVDSSNFLVHSRYPTRDILHVILKVKETKTLLHVLVNHWPARLIGTLKSEPMRINAGDYCGRIVDRVLKFSKKEFLKLPKNTESTKKLNKRLNQNIIIMGDFNDEPFDKSIVEYLRATRNEDNMDDDYSENSFPAAKKYLKKQPHLFNCMWKFLDNPDTGTHRYTGNFYKGDPRPVNTWNVYDQFIISQGLMYGKEKLQLDLDSVEIFTEIMASGRIGYPKKFDKKKKMGYSDHFPIVATISTL